VNEPAGFAPGIPEFIAAVRTRMADYPQSRDPDARRRRFEAYAARFDLPAPDGVIVRDAYAAATGRELPLRLFRPLGRDAPLPTLLYLHGGGFVTGSITSYHALAANICSWTGLQVALLHYRRAPESPFPAARDDVLDALRWLRRHGQAEGVDAARLVLAGESAGGTLALSAAMAMRDAGEAPVQAIGLLCPGPLTADTSPAAVSPTADPFLTASDLDPFSHGCE
jgi:acetyl esterase